MVTPIPQKVLVTGSANSSIRTFFTKLAGLQTKHSFSLCLALDLFSNIDNDSIELAELLAGKIVVPVQVYVAIGDGILPQRVLDKMSKGEEVCKNVTVLSKAGVISLASGLRIGTFGGRYDSTLFESAAGDELPSLASPSFSQADVNSYISLLTPPPSKSSLPSPPIPSPDILITHSTPSSISLLSAKPLVSATILSPPTDEIARLSKAKYHFIGGAGVFWEREPFAWGNEMGGGSCRVISLGELGNKTKERWFYAFSITPKAAAVPIPANATASPFSVRPSASSSGGGPRGMKRGAGTMDNGVNEFGIPNFIFGGQGGINNQDRKKGRNNCAAGGPPPDLYTCNICDQKGHWIQECPEKATRDAERIDTRPSIIKPIQPDECWFCLSNPKLTKHLITSIGSEIYVTLPKGQIPPTRVDGTSSVSPVPGGGHVLIIPIAHYATLLSIPTDAASPILSEIDQYKNALKQCYAEYGAKMVSFEVGRLSGKKGGHAHIQICPVPDFFAEETESLFRSEGKKLGIEFEEDSEAATIQAASSGDYFRVGLPDGKTLVHIMKPKTSFNLQFGRATMSLLMGIPERRDWKACGQDTAEEKRDCAKFKAAFKKYDPSE